MSTTQHTGHYNLPTFGDNPNDRPSWRGDFTDAMTKIDNQMYANATNITTATAAANNANTAAQQAKESADNAAKLAQANKNDIAELGGYFSKLGVTSAQTAQNLMNTINGKAENTALTALQGTVSTLSGKVDGKADSSNVYTKAQADTTFTKQGGYAGTAQQIFTSAQQALTQIADLIANGVAPIDIVGTRGTSLQDAGLTVVYTAYYSPISHMVTVRCSVSGNANKKLNAGLYNIGTLKSGYAITGASTQVYCTGNLGGQGVEARMEFQTTGSVDFRIWADLSAGVNIDVDAIQAYFCLTPPEK